MVEGTPQFACVFVCVSVCVGGRENCQLAGKNNKRGNAMQLGCACLPAHLHRFDVVDGNVQTGEEARGRFLHGGAAAVIHDKLRQSRCFVPYHQPCFRLLGRNLPSSNPPPHTHTRALRLATQFGGSTAPPGGRCTAGPFHLWRIRSISSRCLRSARRRGHGAAVAGVEAGSKGDSAVIRMRQAVGAAPGFWWADIKSIFCSLVLQEEIREWCAAQTNQYCM